MIALAALLAVGTNVPVPLTVPQLLAHIHEWDGRQVAVRGWLHGCSASVTNLSGRCYITPSSSWRRGHDRLKLAGVARTSGNRDGDQVVVRGAVEEARCAADAICLDGESDVRVDTIEMATPLTVSAIQQRHDDLVGQQVQLRGWLLRDCVRLECDVYGRRAGSAATRVSIGTAQTFDDAVRTAVGHEIIMTATVTAHCWPSSGVRCLDRGDRLADPRLLRVLP